MLFFEPLPPLPEPAAEQPTGWVPPLWDRPSEATTGAPVPMVAVLGKSDRVALVLTNVDAYPNGFTFDLLIQRNPMAPRRPDEVMPHWMMGPPHLRRGPRIGFEFADGRRVTEQGPMPFAGRSLIARAGSTGPADEGIPTGPILLSRGGGGGGHDRFAMGFWSFPLPPAGPMTVYAEWTSVGIEETGSVVDASLIVDAAERAVVLWEPPAPT